MARSCKSPRFFILSPSSGVRPSTSFLLQFPALPTFLLSQLFFSRNFSPLPTFLLSQLSSLAKVLPPPSSSHTTSPFLISPHLLVPYPLSGRPLFLLSSHLLPSTSLSLHISGVLVEAHKVSCFRNSRRLALRISASASSPSSVSTPRHLISTLGISDFPLIALTLTVTSSTLSPRFDATPP